MTGLTSKLNNSVIALLLAGIVTGCGPQRQVAAGVSSPGQGGSIEISRGDGGEVNDGPAEWFSGQARVQMRYSATSERQLSAATVSFAPGTRTAWHVHPAGQTLIVTSGTGWVQAWGDKRQEMHAGDVVWIPANVKHWHGATATTKMSHVALQQLVDGKAVDWLEHVTDEQYRIGGE